MNVLEEVRKLIAIPSVTGSEAEIARYLEGRLRGLGCSTRMFEAGAGRFNLYAKFGGEPLAVPGILFHAHMDTVPAHGMNSPFIPREEDGQVYGRGSVDQKGGIAAVVSAFQGLMASGVRLSKPAALICVIDEESEHRGSMALKEMGIAAEFGVVTEPTGLKLGIGCKGTAPILVRVKGKAAHGCRPWLGANAVLAGMDVVRLLMDRQLPARDLPGLGEVAGSLNLGKMDGGRAYNIVADTCDIWFDRRLIPGETQEDVLSQFRETIASYKAGPGISLSAEIARPDWNWEPIKHRGLLPALTDMRSTTIGVLKDAHRSVRGEDPALFFTDGYQEMDFLINDLGINAVQYGPGDSSLCHTDNEHLDIGQLEQCARVYARMIELLCG
ncbi:MAG: M20/M25/M40 family metallo-hydrolase [Rectinemataceae bacterium]|nr:M20/M25/M40 family metallo-hydrolase [Rectinemataceae bacterium]